MVPIARLMRDLPPNPFISSSSSSHHPPQVINIGMMICLSSFLSFLAVLPFRLVASLASFVGGKFHLRYQTILVPPPLPHCFLRILS